MRIREATSRDLEQLLELYSLLEGPYPEAETANGDAGDLFTRVLLDPDQTTLVAEDYGEIVGTLVLVLIPNLAHGGAPYALVENVVVDPENRGEGVGKALMREATDRARRAGAYKLALTTNLQRTKAHEFYETLGLERTHVGFEVAP